MEAIVARTRPPAELLSESEVQRLLLACSPRAPTGVRNRALIALFYCSGLRLAEALALAPADVELDDEMVAVGGERARTAHLFPAARPYLDTWLPVRTALELPAGAPLFSTLAGKPLEPAYVRAMLARLVRRARLSKRVHAHLLRHSFAARLAQEGLAPEALALQLGHGDPRTIERLLAARGIRLVESPSPRARIQDVRWSLQPSGEEVRAIVDLRTVSPRARPEAAAADDRVVVRRAVFDPL